MAVRACALYRPRAPQTTPLYRLAQAHYAEGRDAWEERHERHCGFWRSFADKGVGAYLDCGISEGFLAKPIDPLTLLAVLHCVMCAESPTPG